MKPTIRSGCPLNKADTRLITPGVSILKIKEEIMNADEHAGKNKLLAH